MIRETRSAFPRAWLGVNFLAVTGREAFPVLGRLAGEGVVVDAYWADDACIDEARAGQDQIAAQAIAAAGRSSGWGGLYFGGTAFKKQRPVDPAHYRAAAQAARSHMDVVTTSGEATGVAADVSKVRSFRDGCGDAPLALASGVTPENVDRFARLVDCVLVATGINRSGDFYEIEPGRLGRLLERSRSVPLEPAADRDEPRWYLARMAPNLKGEKFAWLDPSSMYLNARSFHALLDDLLVPFCAAEVDVVAGFDAMGFVLGSAIAARLGRGFLTIRKSGKIPVDTDAVDFVNYSGRRQQLEMRKPAFAAGTRVLLVDQWVETGGTMAAGAALVERQGGRVAGVVAVCIENSPGGRQIRARYRCSTAVQPGTRLQRECDEQKLGSFDRYRPNMTFPEVAAGARGGSSGSGSA